MTRLATAAAILAATTTAATAGGLDRSGQSVGVIFQDGDYVQLSFGSVRPNVRGTDSLANATGNIAGSYTQMSFGYKQQVNETLSFGLIIDQPFGAEVAYSGNPAATIFGGTSASLTSVAYTGLVKYQIDQNISVFAGLRAQNINADVTLNGLGWGGLAGYNVTFGSDLGYGYTVGAAYEIKDIALRVALTYNSGIDHSLPTSDTLGSTANTAVRTPESWNLEFQTGVAPGTLVYGGVRYVPWSNIVVKPQNFPGATLVSLGDSYTWSLGVGRQLNETWAISAALDYEQGGSNPLNSPLAPTDGRFGGSLGAVYTMDNVKITGGIRYLKQGNARAATGANTTGAQFTGSETVAAGLSVGFSF